MKVLWITGGLQFPEVSSYLGVNLGHKASGGWMIASANSLSAIENIKLYVATTSTMVDDIVKIDGVAITYFLIPYGKGNYYPNNEYNKYWKSIYNTIKPDVVHIHGTEYTHGLSYVNECGNYNVVVSIQGLTSEIAKYYMSNLDNSEILKNLTIHDLVAGSLYKEKMIFEKRGKSEIELLNSVRHVVGRTTWDRAHTLSINPNLKYHFCNESLRSDFYDGSWDYSKCVKHRIFASQAGYPIKGVHQLIKAMSLVKKYYNDVTLHIAGKDVTKCSSIRDLRFFKGYGKIIKSLINSYDLNDIVVFTGPLDAAGMKEEYLRCNVFVSCSSLENSPNSLGEAQLLGTPHIASYVGGTMDFMRGNEDNLYRFEDVEMLAQKIIHIFDLKSSQVNMSTIARKRHDPHINTQTLIDIYKDIIENE